MFLNLSTKIRGTYFWNVLYSTERDGQWIDRCQSLR